MGMNADLRITLRQPANLLERHGKDALHRPTIQPLDHPLLAIASHSIDAPRAARLPRELVKHHRAPAAPPPQNRERREHADRKSPARPCQPGVLDQNPVPAPRRAPPPQPPQRRHPAPVEPLDPRQLQLRSMLRERTPEKRAVVFQAVRRHVALAKQRNRQLSIGCAFGSG